MAYGAIDSTDQDQELSKMFDWFNLAFRASIYALLSGWIEDKQDETTVSITVDTDTGEVTEEWERSEMRVPKKYRRSAERF